MQIIQDNKRDRCILSYPFNFGPILFNVQSFRFARTSN